MEPFHPQTQSLLQMLVKPRPLPRLQAQKDRPEAPQRNEGRPGTNAPLPMTTRTRPVLLLLHIQSQSVHHHPKCSGKTTTPTPTNPHPATIALLKTPHPTNQDQSRSPAAQKLTMVVREFNESQIRPSCLVHPGGSSLLRHQHSTSPLAGTGRWRLRQFAWAGVPQLGW